ncbi:MAG TPA: alpha/beta fold hydrolase, partial [Xanthobacteraceae bacterium]|nr:alpha/beta fold hydrolase [Xanthobacteraceae bacterium]
VRALCADRHVRDRPGGTGPVERLAYAPQGAAAYRILYRSKGLANEGIAVSGVVVVPSAAAAGPRGIIAWAHPTTGVTTHCGPSLRRGVLETIPGLQAMLAQGYVVTATDYPGLGTGGTHPYLVGASEGRAVLDSVRAARRIAGAETGNRFAVWGHSQGGHAALYAGILARSYAPELRLVGIAAAAPATELSALLDEDINTVNGRILTAMTLWSWDRIYRAPVERVVDPAAVASVDRLAQHCVQSITDIIGLRLAEWPLERRFLTVDNLAQVEPWRSLLARNTPGRTPAGVPVFLSQGTSDSVVVPAITQDYMASLCRAGRRVKLITLPGVIHAFTAYRSAAAAVEWMSARFAGSSPPDDCTR